MARGDYRFPRRVRLARKRDFDRVFAQKCSAGDLLLVVYACRNGLEFSRVGFCVSRRVGGSVVRNRLKRLLREAFRLNRPELPTGYDFVCLPRQAEGAEQARYQRSMRELFRAAVRRVEKRSGTGQAT